MIIGTTPTLTFKLKKNSNVNFYAVNNIYITLQQGSLTITKTGQQIEIVDTKTISITFTQAESLQFTLDKDINVQLNWTYNENGTTKRAATKVTPIKLDRQLLNEVIN